MPPNEQEVQGSHCSPEKQNKLEQSFDYASRLVKTGKYLQLKRKAAFQFNELEFRLSKDRCFIISPLKMVWPFIWRNLNPFYAWCFVSTLVEIGNVVLVKFLTLSIFTIISPWAFILITLIHVTQECFVLIVLLQLVHWFWRSF